MGDYDTGPFRAKTNKAKTEAEHEGRKRNKPDPPRVGRRQCSSGRAGWLHELFGIVSRDEDRFVR